MARRGPIDRLPQAIAEAVVNRIVEMIDVNEIVERVDVNKIVERIDVNQIVERVDVNEIVERVDVNEIVERVDVDALMARVDVDAVASRLDIDALMRNTEFSSIIAKGTSGALSEFLDLLRRQVVSLDVLLDRVVHRKRLGDVPKGPPALAHEWDDADEGRQGEYAGGVSRFVAIALDCFIAWSLFLLGVNLLEATISVFMATPPRLLHHVVFAVIATAVWYFIYFSAQWSLGGRTLGMAAVGIRVVTDTGEPIAQRQAAIRILMLPVSVFVFFLGLVGILTRGDRRGWHDRVAGTCVVFDWEARAAKMRWLNQRSHVA